jgi:uncharacterized membrane protein
MKVEALFTQYFHELVWEHAQLARQRQHYESELSAACEEEAGSTAIAQR